jgi:solute carrier family 35 protein E3
MVGLLTPALILISICGSTTLILFNKKIMSVYGFGFPTFLTCYHFFLTWAVLTAIAYFRFFQTANEVSEFHRWYMGFFGVVSIVAMNFNLKMNSIGFYQLSKLCTIPCMVVYDYFWLNKTTPWNTLGSLVFLLIGLCLFTVNDVQFNFLGSLVAVLAVVTTTIYQTQTNALQKAYKVNGVRLNQAVSFARFLIALVAAFVIESHGSNNMFAHDFQTAEVVMILFTGCLAVMGNTVGFSLIGRAGAITFQVVGHVKTITVFVFGLLMFPPKVEPIEKKIKKIVGLCIAMVGVILYTVFQIKNKPPENRKPLSSEREDEVVLHVNPEFKTITA